VQVEDTEFARERGVCHAAVQRDSVVGAAFRDAGGTRVGAGAEHEGVGGDVGVEEPWAVGGFAGGCGGEWVGDAGLLSGKRGGFDDGARSVLVRMQREDLE